MCFCFFSKNNSAKFYDLFFLLLLAIIQRKFVGETRNPQTTSSCLRWTRINILLFSLDSFSSNTYDKNPRRFQNDQLDTAMSAVLFSRKQWNILIMTSSLDPESTSIELMRRAWDFTWKRRRALSCLSSCDTNNSIFRSDGTCLHFSTASPEIPEIVNTRWHVLRPFRNFGHSVSWRVAALCDIPTSSLGIRPLEKSYLGIESPYVRTGEYKMQTLPQMLPFPNTSSILTMDPKTWSLQLCVFRSFSDLYLGIDMIWFVISEKLLVSVPWLNSEILRNLMT